MARKLYWVSGILVGILFGLTDNASLRAQDTSPEIPDALKPWKDWVLWDSPHLSCPSPYNSGSEKLCIWPSVLELKAGPTGAGWKIQIRAFMATWLPLPGDSDCWPTNVQMDDQVVPVVSHEGMPSLALPAGAHFVSGNFNWLEQPEKLVIPKSYGMIQLVLNDQPVGIPNWDAAGMLWLNRTQASAEEKDVIELKVNRVIEDGLPIWLRTELDVSVSGKSREEDFGYLLPQGWQLSFVSGPLPVAMDEQGRVKAQVRAGNWKIRFDAFRNQDLDKLQYASETPPAVTNELVAVRSKPVLRMTELQGATPVDVNMTTFPDAWRDLPVFDWPTSQALNWVVKSSGSGLPQPNRYSIRRNFWIDDGGDRFTYVDSISANPKKLSRLDVAAEHDLSGVRINGARQLITQNPQTGAAGVELRTSSAVIEAVGRVRRSDLMQACGWQTDAESLEVTFVMPPGWRMLALFGADRVDGDWLTSWTLLDLFLLLIVTLAAFRLWGWWSCLIVFFAFGLTYHDFGAPRFAWLFLLIPIALLQVVPNGRIARVLGGWRWIAIAILMLCTIPFVVQQIQSALFPQLEEWIGRDLWEAQSRQAQTEQTNHIFHDSMKRGESEFETRGSSGLAAPQSFEPRLTPSKGFEGQNAQQAFQKGNLQNDPGAKIQTGIAKPGWSGREVHCYWDGPVSGDQTIRPVFLSALQFRVLIVTRLVLLAGMLALFLKNPRSKLPARAGRPSGIVAAILLAVFSCIHAAPASAQEIPDLETLNELKARLTQPSDAFPNAAEISTARITVVENRITIEGQIHAAVDCAIPLPGQFPAWSPLSVRIGDASGNVCRRDDGFLWAWVPKGVQRFKVEGLVPSGPEWVWAFSLVPRHVEVDASEWNVTGIRPGGIPESQLFFARKEQSAVENSRYDQRNFRAVVQIERTIEVGLVWKVHTTVRRLSATGKAITLQVPLLPGERVLSSNVTTRENQMDINLAADKEQFEWDGELPIQSTLAIKAMDQPQTVERWLLQTSPVWNTKIEGLQPIYDSDGSDLIPAWYPWPAEQVQLSFERPAALPGETLTVQSVRHNFEFGPRQRLSNLNLEIESSSGGEFPIQLPRDALVTKLRVNRTELPVRKDGDKCLVSLQPGSQSVELTWTNDEPLTLKTDFPQVVLPTEAANIEEEMAVPQSQWILWANGPIRGPAVQYWAYAVLACIVALSLSRIKFSPLRWYEWLLLGLGLTQVPFFVALIVVVWLFVLAARSKSSPETVQRIWFNLGQIGLVVLSIAALTAFVGVVSQGLLGNPDMFIGGNYSYGNQLRWFSPSAGTELPRPWILSISIWYYRLLMLLWALWLANALLRWLKFGWEAFNQGGAWRTRPIIIKPASTTPQPQTPA